MDRSMRKIYVYCITFMGVLTLGGCQTTQSLTSSTSMNPKLTLPESRADVTSALTAIAGAMGGKLLSGDEAKAFKKQVRQDQETQEVLRTLTHTMSVTEQEIKYCPMTGKRYAGHIKICPEHQVPLKILEE